MSEDNVPYTVLGSIIGGSAILGYGMYRYNKHLQSQGQSHDSFATPTTIEQQDSLKFAIGKYNNAKSYGQDWRMAREADWTNPAFQAALVQAHREGGGGWPLLEDPLVCNSTLYVAEGAVMIDGAFVTEVMCIGKELRSKYRAMNWGTEAAWTTTEPALGNNWTVKAFEPTWNPPCLFVHNSYKPLNLGGKRTHRRKHSRKQKRGTRKY